MNIILLFLGTIFFINPCFGLFDFLPDIIGAVIIIFALDKVRFVTDKASKCVNLLYALSGVSLVKCAICYFGSGMSSTTELMWCTVFTFAEAFLIIYSFSTLCSFLDFAKMRYGSEEAATARGADTGKTVKLFTVYTVFRLFFSLLPELTTLADASGGDLNRYLLSSFKGLLYFVFTAVECIFLIFVVVALVRSLRYFNKDKDMSLNAENRYREILEGEPLKIAEGKLGAIYVLFIVCAVCSFCINIDGRDILPKFISSVVFCLLLIFVPVNLKYKIPGFASCLILAISSAFNTALTSEYLEDYSEESSLWIESAGKLYRGVVWSCVIEYLCIFALILLSCELIRKYIYGVLASCGDSAFTASKGTSVKKSINRIALSGLVFCAVSAVVPVLRPHFGMIAMIAVAIGIVFALCVYFADLSLKDAASDM